MLKQNLWQHATEIGRTFKARRSIEWWPVAWEGTECWPSLRDCAPPLHIETWQTGYYCATQNTSWYLMKLPPRKVIIAWSRSRALISVAVWVHPWHLGAICHFGYAWPGITPNKIVSSIYQMSPIIFTGIIRHYLRGKVLLRRTRCLSFNFLKKTFFRSFLLLHSP